MCFSTVALLRGFVKEGPRGKRKRTHLRRGERGCLTERCRAPQGGATPLHRAAGGVELGGRGGSEGGGHAKVVQLLLAAGADVEGHKVQGAGVGVLCTLSKGF